MILYIYTHTLYSIYNGYITLHIQRERERERERDADMFFCLLCHIRAKVSESENRLPETAKEVTSE